MIITSVRSNVIAVTQGSHEISTVFTPPSEQRSPLTLTTMRIVDRIPAVVGFRVIPTTVLVLLTYVTIFTLVIVTDWLPEPPKNQHGLDLKQAYTDLRHVSACFSP